ncbi:MAG: response regulator transcription factor [Cyanobacteriota bacterium]
MNKITIIVADDHAVVRQGTKLMLEEDEDINVIAEAANGTDAINLTNLKKPDILLLDISMPDMNGLEVINKLKAKDSSQKVVIFTAHSDLQYVKAAIKSNVDGYLTKNIDSETLIDSIKRILEGERVVSQDISSQLANQFWSNVKGPADLTSREYEIMLLVAKGKSNQEVAEELCIAVRTVETHVANILKKLKFSNRTQISSYAYQQGLI